MYLKMKILTFVSNDTWQIIANLSPSQLAEYISSKLWIVFVFMFVFVLALVLLVIRFVIKRNKNVPNTSVELTNAVQEFEKK